MQLKVERRKVWYRNSELEVVTIFPLGCRGISHPGWRLVRADNPHIATGEICGEPDSGIFIPDLGRELQRRLEGQVRPPQPNKETSCDFKSNEKKRTPVRATKSSR